jgi:hypothetical protein
MSRKIARLTAENSKLKAELVANKSRHIGSPESEEFRSILAQLHNEYLEYEDDKDPKKKPARQRAVQFKDTLVCKTFMHRFESDRRLLLR